MQMKILFGHPTGNPNSHHAALSHYDSGRLAAFCVPWMPSSATLALLKRIPGISRATDRLERRRFLPLVNAPLIQGKLGEINRLIRRQLKLQSADERLSYEANDWLMRTMAKECRRSEVSAVHSYEDCSLWQFQEAKKAGKACIYDMPIGYYPWWQDKQNQLFKKYRDYLPSNTEQSKDRFVRPNQKQDEMQLADLVLAPSEFVANTIREFVPDKNVQIAPYGVDLDYWCLPPEQETTRHEIHFLFAGQIGIRKGVPDLLEAWNIANPKNAVLNLVGRWSLNESLKSTLPNSVRYHGLCSRAELRKWFHRSDIFVFPTYFEGFPLVVLEAMACGLPVISTEVLSGMKLLEQGCGIPVPSGNPNALADTLIRVTENPATDLATRENVRTCVAKYTWDNYRNAVSQATATI